MTSINVILTNEIANLKVFKKIIEAIDNTSFYSRQTILISIVVNFYTVIALFRYLLKGNISL